MSPRPAGRVSAKAIGSDNQGPPTDHHSHRPLHCTASVAAHFDCSTLLAYLKMIANFPKIPAIHEREPQTSVGSGTEESTGTGRYECGAYTAASRCRAYSFTDTPSSC